MYPTVHVLPQPLHIEPVSDELRSLIQNLLEKHEQQRLVIEKQQQEIEALKDEIRHLKKLKGKPRIRPNKTDQPQGNDAQNPGSTEKKGQHGTGWKMCSGKSMMTWWNTGKILTGRVKRPFAEGLMNGSRHRLMILSFEPFWVNLW